MLRLTSLARSHADSLAECGSRSQKELVTYHNPETYPLGSFELIASNRIRSDEETLGEIFNGQPYYTDKVPADDPLPSSLLIAFC